ncbi:MAG TPA: VTT domain-containing protein [Candidatus Bilamarchaeum sp.]|nr:VTT domain-containing protein [Candidatus Bilamarchaeum sp.]
MEKKTEGMVQVAASVAIAAIVLFFSSEIASLGSLGYVGAFLIALLSSATIIFPAPGWAVIAAMSASFDPLLLGLAAGLGSAIGELSGFVAGDGVRDILSTRIKESKQIEEIVRKYGVFAIGFFAFIPNPLFDVAGVIAGGLKIEWWKFLVACAAGRVLRYVLLAMAGQFTMGLVS